uniref:Period circadian protein n=1 Tax=Cacopsylla melanoneura TaxID=428564 RepID=A0A8D8WAR1_9HEMI
MSPDQDQDTMSNMQESNEKNKSTITMQEETSTTITKDSGYSTSCNSQSQRSGSFKSKSYSNSASSGESSASYRNDNTRQELANKETANQDKMKSTRRHKKKKKMPTSTENVCSHSEQTSTPMETNEQQSCENTGKLSISEPIKEENENECKNHTNKPKPEPPPVSPPSVRETAGAEEKEPVPKEVEADPVPTNNKEFNAIVSMKDGVVLYCTSNLTDVLGFPADMWLGRSFIDFVHMNDRATFASFVASCVTTPDDEERQQASVSNVLFPTNKNKTKKNSVYCCLRHYKSLFKGGYGITERRVNYIPCQLIFNFKEIPVELSDSGMQQGMFLIITARAVHSIYKVPDEKIVNSEKVFIKHNNLCQISYVNDEILPKFGYLPHRTIGRSIFNFYHPEDLPYIKKIYSDLLKNNSNSKQKITSKPIRFRCQNGYFAMVETEWSTFINPWTGKLEFITGHHTVVQGPHQLDVCTIVEVQEPYMLSDEKLKHCNMIQDEIHNMLDKPVIEHVAESKSKISQEPKGLSSFMESLIKNTITTTPSCSNQNEIKIEVAPTENISERDSVMLGEISPHHDYSDGKSSSETPPSYNQLNYDDNIQRFFESKPKTSPSHSKSDETNKTSDKTKLSESSETSGDSESFTKDASRKQNYHLKLTEESLIKHNADMEKKMVQKHKEQKLNTKYNKNKQMQEDSLGAHGVKRSGSHSWENEPFKSAKQNHHHGDRNYSGDCTTRTSRHPNTSNCVSTTSINLWPPFNVNMNPLISTTNTLTPSTLVPYLYIPSETPKLGTNLSSTSMPSMPGIPYVSPFVYPLPLPMYSPMLPFYSALPLNNLTPQPSTSNVHSRLPDIQPTQPSTSNTQPSIENPVSSFDNSFTGDDSSYQSSMYSLLRTDDSSPEEDNTKTVKKPPPQTFKKTHMEHNAKLGIGIVRMFPKNKEQLQYQLAERKLNEVLSKDLIALNKLNQPDLVNVQLSQLYSELELEGIRRLKFEDGFTSSDGLESFGNTSSDENSSGKPPPIKKKIVNYDNLSRLFEENAPMPPPDVEKNNSSGDERGVVKSPAVLC